MRAAFRFARWSRRSTLLDSSSFRVEVCPPSLRQAPPSLWQRLVFWMMAPSPQDASPPPNRLPPVRAEFLRVLQDISGEDANRLRWRIDEARSLRELWHLHLVADGLDPDFLGDIAGFSGLDSRDVLDFAGIDRTTVSRRKASGSALPQDAAVKALQITDLLTQATEVFGSPAQASTWLTRPHPSLDGDTPLKRARTPWGMSKVQSILVALRYGAAA